METTAASRYIAVNYRLFTIDGEKETLVEQTQQGNPFVFVSGLGMALDAFEAKIVDLAPGSTFEFCVSPADGFGDYDPEGVHQLKREAFSINGHFDHEHIYEGAVITMEDEEEHRFMARVTEVTDDHVTIDTNHPLAGETLRFTGLVIENREASTEEVTKMINHMGHECCGCDDCNEEGHEHKEGGCGCGHCHH